MLAYQTKVATKIATSTRVERRGAPMRAPKRPGVGSGDEFVNLGLGAIGEIETSRFEKNAHLSKHD